jgi:hypothetical protein
MRGSRKQISDSLHSQPFIESRDARAGNKIMTNLVDLFCPKH